MPLPPQEIAGLIIPDLVLLTPAISDHKLSNSKL